MRTKRNAHRQQPTRPTDATVRSSISFAPDVYQTLELIAKQKKVSLAWVVREAVDKYIADKWPLFGEQ